MFLDWNDIKWKSRRYREHFMSATAKRAFAFQLQAIMQKRKLSQERLAEMCGLTQGVISRASDPEYGKLTVATKTKIAAGLDMAYLGTLVPFSHLEKWFLGLSEEAVQVATFEEENAVREKAEREAELASYARTAKPSGNEAINMPAGRLTQEECAQKLADWLMQHAGYTYHEKNLRGFGIDGEVDLMDLAIFVLDTLMEHN
jgi:transcriptional regulator with XRE-family HTH domain